MTCASNNEFGANPLTVTAHADVKLAKASLYQRNSRGPNAAPANVHSTIVPPYQTATNGVGTTVRSSFSTKTSNVLDFNITGFLPARAIGDKVEVKGPTIVIKIGKRALSFTEGHPIAVRVKDVDFVRLQVMLELA